MMDFYPHQVPNISSCRSPEVEENNVFYMARHHCTEAFQMMNKMRVHKEMCDIILDVEGFQVYGHKVVLASSSPYFHAMFTNEMIEKDSKLVELHDIDPNALELLVDFIYTSEITVTEQNVQILLPAASLLQLQSVRDACCKFLMKQLHPTNCLGIRSFADTHACDELLHLSHEYILNNFVDVCNTEEFLLLPVSEVLSLVESEELNITSEEQVFLSILRWIKHSLEERERYIAELLRCVRLPLMTREFLMCHVESEAFIRNHNDCKDLLLDAMKYHLMPDKRCSLQSQMTQLRRKKDLRTAMVAVGGGSLFAIHSECELFDAQTSQWFSLAPMSSRRARAGVTSINRQIYAVGGYDGASDLSSGECYNPHTNSWTHLPAMGTKRSCLGVCNWNGLLYAIGGYDGASCLSSAERFDPLTQTWTSVPAMTYRRRYLKLAVLDQCIYAVGGYDGCTHLATVEKFDPQTKKWSLLPNMISRRSNAGIAVYEGMIYVCGGNDGTANLSSVERFNPRRNMWENVASMHSRRSTHDVLVMDGHIWAIGGNDGSTSLNSVERFNVKTNRWTLTPPMILRRSNVGAATLELSSIQSLRKENERN